MKIIIAPAKKMTVARDDFAVEGKPQYIDHARELLTVMRRQSLDELQQLWQCSDKLARQNYAWLQRMDVDKCLTPALISYTGIQYQYMAPDIFSTSALQYVSQHLRILSGLYGILRPFDGIVPYRLEMQAKLRVGTTANLYAYWHGLIYRALNFSSGPVINLASTEYTKAVRPFLQPHDQLIDVVFKEPVGDRLVIKATLAKMARGAMVRFMAENQVKTVEELTRFDYPHYHFDAQLSAPSTLVFVNQA